MKAFKEFIKPFEATQRSLKKKIQLTFSLSGIGMGSVKFWNAKPESIFYFYTIFEGWSRLKGTATQS